VIRRSLGTVKKWARSARDPFQDITFAFLWNVRREKVKLHHSWGSVCHRLELRFFYYTELVHWVHSTTFRINERFILEWTPSKSGVAKLILRNGQLEEADLRFILYILWVCRKMVPFEIVYITFYYVKIFPKHSLVHIISQKKVTYEEFTFILSSRSAALPCGSSALPGNLRETCSRPRQEHDKRYIGINPNTSFVEHNTYS